MFALERYEIEQNPAQITVDLKQRRSAIVNAIVAAGILGLATFLLPISDHSPLVPYALMVFGVLWLMVAIAAFRQGRRYSLTKERIEYQSSGRSKLLSLAATDLSSVLLQKIVRPTGARKRKIPFPWRVILVNSEKQEFKGQFKFQKEEQALRLASMIADFYEVEISREEK